MPVEPPPSPWDLPGPAAWAPDDDLVAVGADLEPGTLLAAYRRGMFPMPSGGGTGRGPHRRQPLLWFSPVRRGVLPLDALVVSRSLRRSLRDVEVRVDTAFDAVVAACADPRREHGWIDPAFRAAYGRLHRLGWAHSVEAWHEGELVGGLYGVAIGGLFAGESMFHRRRDASKAALAGLVERLRADGRDGEGRLLDVQWQTPHLASLGVAEVEREAYLRRLDAALALPAPPALVPTGGPPEG